MAGTITHKWYGTTLAITSDSGTSMCDLKGAQGDMGIRGPQGAPGVIRKEDGTVDMTAYATETYVDEKLAGIDVNVDLSDYYTKAEADMAAEQMLEGYATEEYVQDQMTKVDVDVDLSNYYTKEEVSAEIAKAQLGGSDVDLSAYYTKSETDAAIAEAVDIPYFDLVEMGLPDVQVEGGGTTVLETDTTAIMAALEKGAARFRVNMQYRGVTMFMAVTMHDISSPDGNSYICSYSFDMVGGFPIMLTIVVEDGKISTIATMIEAKEVPTSIDLSALDTEGKIVETFADGTTQTTTIEFNAIGNPVKITDGDGNVTTLTW